MRTLVLMSCFTGAGCMGGHELVTPVHNTWPKKIPEELLSHYKKIRSYLDPQRREALDRAATRLGSQPNLYSIGLLIPPGQTNGYEWEGMRGSCCIDPLMQSGEQCVGVQTGYPTPEPLPVTAITEIKPLSSDPMPRDRRGRRARRLPKRYTP